MTESVIWQAFFVGFTIFFIVSDLALFWWYYELLRVVRTHTDRLNAEQRSRRDMAEALQTEITALRADLGADQHGEPPNK